MFNQIIYLIYVKCHSDFTLVIFPPAAFEAGAGGLRSVELLFIYFGRVNG